jgi:Flp pilus assembly protein TadD
MQVPEHWSDCKRTTILEGSVKISGHSYLLLSVGRRRWGRVTLVAFARLVLVLAGTVCAAQAPSAEGHANKATGLVQEGNLKEAESELRSAVDLAPNDASFLTSLGTVLAMQRKFEESTGVFKQALKITPNDVTVRRYLAANLWQLHRYSEARQNLEIILKKKPDDKPARLLLGMVSENVKDYEKAAQMLASVPEQVRQQPESIAALARSYYHLGRTVAAQATLSELARFSGRPDVILLGAQIADEGKDYSTAERMLSSIQSSSSDPWKISYKIALVQYHAQRFDESQHTILMLIETHPRSEFYNLLGWCYHKQNHPDRARQSLERAIELAPSDERNYLDLGEILVADRSFPAALGLAKRMTLALPDDARAFEFRGMAEARVGQFSDSVVSYSRALQLDSSRPETLLGLAQAQFDAGMKEEGTERFEAGLKQFPRDVRFKARYAAILLKESETGDAHAEARAESLLRSALASDHSLPDAHFELGNLALRKGRLAEAVQHLEEAEKLEPQSSEVHFALSRAYRRLGRKDQASRELEVYRNLSNVPQPAVTLSGEQPR